MRALRHASGGLIALGHSGWYHSRRRFMPVGIGPGLAPAAVGALLTLFIAVLSARVGATIGLGLLVGVCLFIAVLTAFIMAPHIAVAFTIPYFAALPTLKALVTTQLAPTKDIIEIAAVLAAGILAVRRRAARREWTGDTTLLIITLLLIGLYILDLGAGVTGGSRYGLNWFHGVRLVAEPLALLLVGLVLVDPRRTFRWAVVSLIATAYVAALLGILQQELGANRLVSIGYTYGQQVRTIGGGHLRSFGTFDQPFDYAAMLTFGLAGVLLWLRRGTMGVFAVIIIGLGLAASFVRGAVLSVVALLALLLARRGHTVGAALVLGAAVASGAAFMFSATQPSAGQVVQAGPSQYLTLNGRTRSWPTAIGRPKNWAFGRGVGLYGTAAERAARTRPPAVGGAANTAAVDSGYLATTADVGFIGLAVLLALFGRILVLLRGAIARGEDAAWLGVGIVVAFMLDAALRSSFTGFPTAHVGMLLIGLTLSATSAEIAGPHTRAALPRWRRA